MRPEHLRHLPGAVSPESLDVTATTELASTIGTVSPQYWQLRATESDTALDPSVFDVQKDAKLPLSIEERARLWFFQYLDAMPRDAGYVMFMVMFPIYERHARRECGVTTDSIRSNTPEGGAFYEKIRQDFGLDITDEAIAFWEKFRHGLCHRAAIKQNNKKGQWDARLGEHLPGDRAIWVESEGSVQVFRVDPMAVKDRILPLLKADVEMWNDPDYPLPEVVRFIAPAAGVSVAPGW